MLDKILSSIDQNSIKGSMAIILQIVDWKQALDRQSHKHEIQSFIENGVRPSMIPVLLSFFQNRQMRVKWRGLLSKLQALPGEEYLSQSNGNTDFRGQDKTFKFIDDTAIIEILNLISIALTSYNFQQHVASDNEIGNGYLEPKDAKS